MTAGDAGRRRAYVGWEALLDLPDKEAGQADLLGWDARRMRRWLGRLGDPQLRLRCTLVTGSKGKGSTAAFLEAALRAAGHRTALYTQPHLHRYRERVRIGGWPLPAAASRAALAAVLGLAPGPVTAFEAATAAAFWAFAQAGVEDAVLELGFGGRLDAVAECEPVQVLFTPLEVEHAEIFGPDLASVSAHDLALIRFGRHCLSGRQRPEVAAEFARRLSRHGATGAAVPLPAPGGPGTLQIPDGPRIRVRLGMEGAFQWENAALAAAGAAYLGASPEAIARGLSSARLPGRFETVGRRPRLIVDGAHTPGSMAALAAAVGQLGPRPRVALILGVLRDKDMEGIADVLREGPWEVWATRPRHPRAVAAADLAEALDGLGRPVHCVPEVAEAVARARAWAGPQGLCVVAGSLSLAAEVRALRAAERAAGGAPARPGA